MAIDPMTAAAVAQGSQNMLNIGSQMLTNRWNRKWQEEMYEKQKQDNIQLWKMQNEYNDPAQQMTRLRQAGLNPNLVYGKGADTTAGSIQSPSAPKHTAIAPQLDLDFVGMIRAFQDYNLRQAQTDNVYKQNEILGIKKQAMELGLTAQAIKNSRDKLGYDLALSTYNDQVMAMSLKNDIMKSQIANYGLTGENIKRDIRFKDATFDTNVNMAKQKLTNEQLNATRLALINKNIQIKNLYDAKRNETETLRQAQISQQIEKLLVERNILQKKYSSMDMEAKRYRIQTDMDQVKMQLKAMGIDDKSPFLLKMMGTTLMNLTNALGGDPYAD